MTGTELATGETSARADPRAPSRSEANGEAVLAVRDLHVRFRTAGGFVYAVNGVSLELRAGETLAVIGESGSGKTVLFRAVEGLLPPNAEVNGSARLTGQELIGLSDKQLRTIRGQELAMVFQDPTRSLNPTMTIGKQLREVLRKNVGLSREESTERAIELLRTVRIPAPENRFHEYPHQLSGGMRQRVMIALAISRTPKLLVADEATTALDVTTQAQIMELLIELQEKLGTALVVISHDMGLAAAYTHNVAVMYAGRIVERASTRELFAHTRMPYTRVLLDAVPRVERPAHTRLPSVLGAPPELRRVATSCPFEPRCSYSRQRCREAVPLLEEPEDGHAFACFYPLGAPARETDGARP